jgi:hypothetical protein
MGHTNSNSNVNYPKLTWTKSPNRPLEHSPAQHLFPLFPLSPVSTARADTAHASQPSPARRLVARTCRATPHLPHRCRCHTDPTHQLSLLPPPAALHLAPSPPPSARAPVPIASPPSLRAKAAQQPRCLARVTLAAASPPVGHQASRPRPNSSLGPPRIRAMRLQHGRRGSPLSLCNRPSQTLASRL